MSKRRLANGGFTLLEVMIALVISATLVLTARELLLQLGESDARLNGAARVEARRRNARQFVERALSQMEVGADSNFHFSGEPTRVSFSTWCKVANGWQERCRVEMRVDTLLAAQPLQLASSVGDTITLNPAAAHTSFRYFLDPEDREGWVFYWLGGSTAPNGLAVVTPSDTTLFRMAAHE